MPFFVAIIETGVFFVFLRLQKNGPKNLKISRRKNMYDITMLKILLAVLANNGAVIATKIAALHPYRDGHTIREEIIGRRVTVVFPAAGYQTLDVKVSDPTDAITPLLDQGKTVYVDFDGFEAHIYDFTDKATGQRRLGISAKADAVRVIPAPAADDLLIE